MKCNDCGNQVGSLKKSKRSDVCDMCWSQRIEIMNALKERKISMDSFRLIQNEMALGTGKAAGMIKGYLMGYDPIVLGA